MKKQWISVKCGLSNDPKHRRVMGESVWLFLHMLDTADWDTGIVGDWKDEAAAETMGMPVRTLREHRRKLAEAGYITCNQKQYDQDIVIHNWTNPREYSGNLYNKKQGDRITEPEGYIQGDTQGNRKDVTPTYRSNTKDQIKEAATPPSSEIIEKANKDVDGFLEFEKAKQSAIQAGTDWRGRELLPPNLLPYGDWWNSKTGQEMYPAKGKQKLNAEWMKAFKEWDENDLDTKTLDEIYSAEVSWKKVIGKPSELTTKAIALQALPPERTEEKHTELDPYASLVSYLENQ